MSAENSPLLYPDDSAELWRLLSSLPADVVRSDANCLLDSVLAIAESLAEKPCPRMHFGMLYLLRQAKAMHFSTEGKP